MKLLELFLCLALVEVSYADTIPLYWYNSSTSTSISDVRDGSKLYLASSDSAAHLSKITVASNGQTKRLDQLLTDFDVNGFLSGFPVNKDLTIATTNSQAVTDALNGILFISTPDMVKDPNFLVYLVSNQAKVIDRSAFNETTLVLLNVFVPKAATDPATKPLTNTRVENIKQSVNSQLYMYKDVPSDGYTDPSYRDTQTKQIFKNPVTLLPTGYTVDSIFFDNIEPIQYTLRTWHIRAIGGGISLNVSRDWQDQTAYQTTAVSTTGYTMSQPSTFNSKVMYKYTPNHDALTGYVITTTGLFADMNVTSCDGTNCQSDPFSKNIVVLNDFFQYFRNDTVLSLDIENIAEPGYYELQYFRFEGNVLLPNATIPTSGTVPTVGTGATSTQLPDTTTKGSVKSSVILAVTIIMAKLL